MTHVLTHRGLPDGMTRWDLYGLLVKAAKHFGLTDTMLKYLRFAISRTQDQDYAAGSICALWPSVSETASQLEADPRQIARAEARLAELGFVVKSIAARCRRYGVRSENIIRYAFGINLAPLVDRAREVEAAARKTCFEKEEAKRLRLYIPKLLERVRTSGDASAEEAAEVILPSRRPSRIWRCARLKEIADALEALIETFADASVAVEMSDQCDTDVAPREGRKTNSKRSSSGQPDPRLSPAQFCILASPGFEDAVRQYAPPPVRRRIGARSPPRQRIGRRCGASRQVSGSDRSTASVRRRRPSVFSSQIEMPSGTAVRTMSMTCAARSWDWHAIPQRVVPHFTV
ncbi:hypothetical protein HC022_10475 [Salipiger sp. HF18]|uniref:helix-turn-helix domain-containing protein n=1 Tax=Salipiger sp. HF18 TaxID=2721557 RepID=UPI00142DE246|nr:helix-turn-helix domain-containing protein [Salipiger sp. HF18]NIY96656.1 hypothetical protein [Salipiger sp. HF18]